MNLHCYGINHETTPLEIRERFALAEGMLLPALQHIQNFFDDDIEVMIISTCNRLEIYTATDKPEQIKIWLSEFFQIPAEQLQPLLYCYADNEVVRHAIRVASGLDSMVLGEPQILGQMKCAYAQAGEAGCVGQKLGHLLPFVFAAAKKVRTESRIGHSPVSVAYAAVNLAKQTVQDIANAKVLLLGAGNTIELVAKHVAELGCQDIIVANRTVERAQALAEVIDAKTIIIGDIPDHIHNVDIIITSTASQLPLIGKGLIERVMKQRPDKPMFIVDIAVPRDVEPEVAELNNVILHNIDALQTVVENNKQQRQLAAQRAEQLVIAELNDFQRWKNSLESVPMICAYRRHFEQMRDHEVNKALQQLQQGKEMTDVLNELARNLTNKLMHSPSIGMRKASSEGREDLLQWSKQLLGIQANEAINRG